MSAAALSIRVSVSGVSFRQACRALSHCKILLTIIYAGNLIWFYNLCQLFYEIILPFLCIDCNTNFI